MPQERRKQKGMSTPKAGDQLEAVLAGQSMLNMSLDRALKAISGRAVSWDCKHRRT